MSRILDAITEKIDDLKTCETATVQSQQNGSANLISYCHTQIEGDHIVFLASTDHDLSRFHQTITKAGIDSRNAMLQFISNTINEL